MVHEQYDAFDLISIRAPARGATRMSNIMFGNFFRFQSALPRGERLFLLLSSCYLLHISIRAPARGATPVAPVQPEPTEISIRAPARGATLLRVLLPVPALHFNPRSREGSDFVRSIPAPPAEISIRAPARGATVSGVSKKLGAKISIRAPARGATYGFDICSYCF